MNVLLIDDHPVVREGLVKLLQELEPGVAWAEASGIDEALRKGDNFDLILLDIHLEGVGGTSGLARVRNSFASAMLVVVSADEDPVLVRRCIELGASGFIPKSSSPAVCKLALQLVLSGGSRRVDDLDVTTGERVAQQFRADAALEPGARRRRRAVDSCDSYFAPSSLDCCAHHLRFRAIALPFNDRPWTDRSSR